VVQTSETSTVHWSHEQYRKKPEQQRRKEIERARTKNHPVTPGPSQIYGPDGKTGTLGKGRRSDELSGIEEVKDYEALPPIKDGPSPKGNSEPAPVDG